MRVTAILQACGLRQWPECISEEDRQWYMQRGSANHAATAQYDAGTLDWHKLDPRISGFVQGYEKFRREVGGIIVAREQKVHGIGYRMEYEGTLDIVLENCKLYPGRARCVLFDIKTNDADRYTRLQTSGYKLAYRGTGMKFLKRGFISLHENGSYHAGLYDGDASDDFTWRACVKWANGVDVERQKEIVHSWLTKHGVSE